MDLEAQLAEDFELIVNRPVSKSVMPDVASRQHVEETITPVKV